MADETRDIREPVDGFYLGNGVTVYRLPAKYGYIVVRPGDMMYNTPEAAEVAARTGTDLDQKVGCHYAWDSPTIPDDIKKRMRDRWTKNLPHVVACNDPDCSVCGSPEDAEPQDDTDHEFYTLRRKREQEKLFARIKATSDSDLCALVFFLSFDGKNVQRMHEALDQLEKLHG